MKKLILNNKGFILIAFYMVITVLLILVVAFTTRSIGEERASTKQRDSIQAFWLAEAGMDVAIEKLPDTSVSSGTINIGGYSAQTTALGGNRFLIVSLGGVPDTNIANPNNTIQQIRSIVEQLPNTADPSTVTSVISANGNIDIYGSVDITGTVSEMAVFDFEDIFGISKATMKSSAGHLYSNPPNNITPVDSITWAEMPAGEEMVISSNLWNGSGILIVNGDLKITGGTFTGVIWVIGQLRVSGNPNINGAIFVESGAELETTLTGNPTITYDLTAITNGFSNLPAQAPQLMSWKED